MEIIKFKLLSILLIAFLTLPNQINCQCENSVGTNVKKIEEKDIIIENILDQKSIIKSGDIIECEIIKTKSFQGNENDIHVFSQRLSHPVGYFFYPISKDKKCFSFDVRIKDVLHLMLSPVSRPPDSTKIEIRLVVSGNSIIRLNYAHAASTVQISNMFNEYEFRGFWVRWLDDQFLEFGRDTDTNPILQYKAPEKLSINFIGLLNDFSSGEWIIHKDPKCGPYKNNITEKIQAESKCKILDKKNNVLQNLQQHILNQIKNEYEIFKLSKFRSREFLIEYQQLIRKQFRDAELNQNKIYANDNENYCPLKAAIYNEISKEYFQFLEELELELSQFGGKSLDDNINGQCNGCCGCNIIKYW